MSFVKQFFTSIYKFHNYPALMLNSKGRAAGYYILFSFLTTILVFGAVMQLYYSFGGINTIFDKFVPQFSITDGKLSCDTIDKEIDGLKVYINTNEKFDFNEKTGDGLTYIIADSESYAVYNGMQKVTGSFSDFGNVDKEDLKSAVSSKEFKSAIAITSVVIIFLNQLISGLGGLCALALIGSIINLTLVRASIGLGGLFKLSIYARTFPALLKCVAALFGIQFNLIVYLGLLITYIYLGLKNIKSGSGIIIAEI